jgi:hypothetical protein
VFAHTIRGSKSTGSISTFGQTISLHRFSVDFRVVCRTVRQCIFGGPAFRPAPLVWIGFAVPAIKKSPVSFLNLDCTCLIGTSEGKPLGGFGGKPLDFCLKDLGLSSIPG